MSATLEVVLKVKNQMTGEMAKVEGTFARFKKNISTGWKEIATIPNLIAGAAFVRVGQGMVKAAMEMEALQNKMKAAIPDARDYADVMAYVRTESDRMGIGLKSSADGFAGFAAAALRSNMSLEQVKKVYSDISEVAVGLRLSGGGGHHEIDRVKLVFEALQQMASKGVVSMEELRRQLGDSLPGAVAIAAKSMDMTSAAFQKAVSSGQIMASDFLPKFAAQVKKELGGSFEQASQSMQANLSRASNAWFVFKAGIGSAFAGNTTASLKWVADALTTVNENMGKLKVAVQVVLTPLTVLWNGLEMAADTLVAGMIQVYEIVKLVADEFIGWFDMVITGINGIDDVLIKAFKFDFKGAFEAGRDTMDSILDKWKDVTATTEQHITNRRIAGETWSNAVHKNLEDIASQYVRVADAIADADKAANGGAVAGGGSGGGGGGGDTGPALLPGNLKYGPEPRGEDVLLKNIESYNLTMAKLQEKAAEKAIVQVQNSEAMLAEIKIASIEDTNLRELEALDRKYLVMYETAQGNEQAITNLYKAHTIERENIEAAAAEHRKQRSEMAVRKTVSDLRIVAGQWREFAGVYKGIAIAQALWDTYQSANSAYASASKIPYVGWVMGPIAAGAAVAAGIANVNSIRSASFATGVDNFRVTGPTMIRVGDNPGGVEDVSVTPRSSANVNGPRDNQGAVFNFFDYSGNLVESFREKIRAGAADNLILELSEKMGLA